MLMFQNGILLPIVSRRFDYGSHDGAVFPIYISDVIVLIQDITVHWKTLILSYSVVKYQKNKHQKMDGEEEEKDEPVLIPMPATAQGRGK
jgi:hypothetical protein